MLVKPYMTGNVKTVTCRIKASVAMMRGAVPKENTRNGAKVHLMFIVRSEMWVTLAAKHLQKREIWFAFKDVFKW